MNAQQLADALAAATADLQATMGSKARLVLPVFEGKLDGQATRNFVTKVDGYARVTRLNNEETAQAVAFAMVPGSAADHWLINLKEREADVADAWDALRPRLITRFSPALTATEKAAAVDGCKQGKHEEVPRFRDQCETIQLLLDRDMDDDLKINANAANYAIHFNAGILSLFLRGLREEGGLKSHVNAAINCATLTDFVTAATKYERHITKAVRVVVAELQQEHHGGVEDDDSDEEREIAALRAKQASRRQGGKKGDGRTGGGNGQWKAKNKNAPTSSSGTSGPRLCWSCQSASHLNRECPNKKKMTTYKPSMGGGGGGGGVSGTAIVNAIQAGFQNMWRQEPQYDQQSNQSEHSSRFSNIDSLDSGFSGFQ